MTPNPILLGKLSRSKILTRWQAASVGSGERRSRAKGAGMEFADHKDYQPGDDFRYLDPHVHARTGKNYIRQYDVYRQLPITILIDSSRSMAFGDPTKFAFCQGLASSLAFIGLAGGDQVQVGVGTGDKVHWSPRFHGVMRASHLFDWIGEQEPARSGSFGGALRLAMRHIKDRGLLIVLSDLWATELEADLGLLYASGQEVWGMHILTPHEIDPAKFGDGEVRMVDAEDGQEVEITLDSGTVGRYRKSFEAWREQTSAYFNKIRGRYLMVSTDQAVDRLLTTEWRALGLLS